MWLQMNVTFKKTRVQINIDWLQCSHLGRCVDNDVPIIHSLKHIVSPYSMLDIQGIF